MKSRILVATSLRVILAPLNSLRPTKHAQSSNARAAWTPLGDRATRTVDDTLWHRPFHVWPGRGPPSSRRPRPGTHRGTRKNRIGNGRLGRSAAGEANPILFR